MIENIVHMGGLAENSRVSAATIDATLQRLWVLYTDHEMTCSTAAFLHVASTQANPVSSLIAAVVAGYGPLRGGAIETAYSVIREVGIADRVPHLIAKVKRKECRLFGYGLRIYRGTDPRAKAIKEMLHDLMREIPVNELDPLLKVASRLIALLAAMIISLLAKSLRMLIFMVALYTLHCMSFLCHEYPTQII
jgi:citrate synthase